MLDWLRIYTGLVAPIEAAHNYAISCAVQKGQGKTLVPAGVLKGVEPDNSKALYVPARRKVHVFNEPLEVVEVAFKLSYAPCAVLYHTLEALTRRASNKRLVSPEKPAQPPVEDHQRHRTCREKDNKKQRYCLKMSCNHILNKRNDSHACASSRPGSLHSTGVQAFLLQARAKRHNCACSKSGCVSSRPFCSSWRVAGVALPL